MTLLKLIVNRLYCAVLSLDQLGSAVIFGRPDHTISGEVGYAALNSDKSVVCCK